MRAAFVATLLLFVLSNCGSSKEGESCAKTGDCQGDLLCIEQKCMSPADHTYDLMIKVADKKRAEATEGGACDPSKDSGIASGYGPEDAWGLSIRYRCFRGKITVTSDGRDRKPDTEDDLTIEQRL